MLIEPACNYLFNYFAWRKNIEDIDDQGLTVLLTLLQSQFQMNFNIPHYATSFHSAIHETYKHIDEKILKNDVIGRDYLYKAYKGTISKQELYTNLFKYPINKKTGYEITHIILALTFVEKTYRIQTVCKVLIKLIETLQFSDLQTEAIYLLLLINPKQIKLKWINNLQKQQQENGSLLCTDFGKFNDATAHHTALGLLVYKTYEIYKKRNIKIFITILILFLILVIFT